MYASRRLHTKQWSHQGPDERYEVRIERAGKPVPGIRLDHISDVEEEVMCWRKANHIHAWFVDNVQNGLDNCQPYYVDWDDLRQLVAVCEKVLNASHLVERSAKTNKSGNSKYMILEAQRDSSHVIEDPTVAQELLPVREGFFFGSYDYDEYYIDHLYQTLDWAERMLTDNQSGVPGDIYYRSDW